MRLHYKKEVRYQLPVDADRLIRDRSYAIVIQLNEKSAKGFAFNLSIVYFSLRSEYCSHLRKIHSVVYLFRTLELFQSLLHSQENLGNLFSVILF